MEERVSEGLEQRLDRLESLESIRRLAHEYALAVDQRDLDRLVGLFVDDVRVDREGNTGRTALAELFDTMLRGFGATVHLVANHLISLDGDRASGVVYCRAEQEIEGRWVVQAMQYDDRYERRDDRWYFSRRRPLVWYAVEAGESPAGPRKRRWPGREPAEADIPGPRWPTWESFWAAGSPPAG